jgi:hypothetical protein
MKPQPTDDTTAKSTADSAMNLCADSTMTERRLVIAGEAVSISQPQWASVQPNTYRGGKEIDLTQNTVTTKGGVNPAE